MPEVLRQIAVTVPPEADEEVAALLEKEFGQTPAIYHDLATGLTTVSVYWGLPAAEVRETRALLRDGLREIAEGVAQGMGARAEVELAECYPVTVNHPEATDRFRQRA